MTRVLVFLAAGALTAGAQAPANDLCGGATPLVVGVSTAGTTSGAGSEGPACGTGFPASTIDVFYTYTPAVDEACTLTKIGGGGGLNRAAAFTGSCGALTAVSCAANFSTGEPLTWLASAGVSYTLRLGTTTIGSSFTVQLTTASPIANDDCSSPTILADGVNPGAPLGASGNRFTSTGATTALLPPGPCGFATDTFDVWFQYTAVGYGAATFQTCTPGGFSAGSFTNTNLQVFTGTCGSLVAVACDADSCGSPANNSFVSLTVSAGVNYLIRVSGTSGTAGSANAQGTFYLTVTAPPTPPANDSCGGATPLVPGVPANGTTLGAGAEGPACGVNFPASSADVFYTYIPLVDEACTLTRLGGSTAVNRAAVFTGTCGALTAESCALVFGGSDPLTWLGRAGVTYTLRVGGTGPTPGPFSVQLTTAPPLANDDCSAPTALSAGVNPGAPLGTSGVLYSNVGATSSLAAPGTCFPDETSNFDVWFSYAAAADGPTLVRTCTPGGFAPGALNDSNLRVYTGTCGALVEAACDANGCGTPANNASVSLTMTTGVVYLIRVSGNSSIFGSSQSVGSFYLTVEAPAPNDACADAAPLQIGTNLGSTFGATADAGAASGTCGTFAPGTFDVWHEFTPVVDCTVALTRSGTGAQMHGVYAGVCGSLTPVVCTSGAILTAVLSGGTTYRLRVGRTAAPGFYTIDYQCAPLPANDECSGAAPLALGANAGSTVGATSSASGNLCGAFGPSIVDVWHAFTAPSYATYNFALTGATQLALSTSACPGATGDVGCGATFAHLMAANATVYVRVGSSAGVAYALTVTQSPANDTIQGAIPVAVGVNPSAPNGASGVTFTNAGANGALDTNGGLIPAPGCAPMNSDVYFSWVAPFTCDFTVGTCPPTGFVAGTNTDTVLQVLNGTGTAQIACDDDSDCGFLSRATFTAAAGAAYVFRVGTFGALTDGTFYLVVTPAPFALELSSVGSGTLTVRDYCGDPGNIYLNFFTLTAGAYPNGVWFGLSMTFPEVMFQMTSGVAPFFGLLDATGQATFGPLFGLPASLSVYGVALQFDTSGVFKVASAPVSFLTQ